MLFHELREHELKIVDVASREQDDVQRIFIALDKQNATYDEFDKKITRLEAISEVIEQ